MIHLLSTMKKKRATWCGHSDTIRRAITRRETTDPAGLGISYYYCLLRPVCIVWDVFFFFSLTDCPLLSCFCFLLHIGALAPSPTRHHQLRHCSHSRRGCRRSVVSSFQLGFERGDRKILLSRRLRQLTCSDFPFVRSER